MNRRSFFSRALAGVAAAVGLKDTPPRFNNWQDFTRNYAPVTREELLRFWVVMPKVAVPSRSASVGAAYTILVDADVLENLCDAEVRLPFDKVTGAGKPIRISLIGTPATVDTPPAGG